MKAALVSGFNEQCCICGLVDKPYIYDFHHLSPQEKKFGISANGSTRSKNETLLEIQKCCMVCANCHRKIENNDIAEITPIPFSQARFDITFNNLLSKKPKEKIIKQKVDKPSRIELKEMVRKLSFSEIGRRCGVYPTSIRRWCIGYSLPNTKLEIMSKTQEEWDKC